MLILSISRCEARVVGGKGKGEERSRFYSFFFGEADIGFFLYV